MYRFSYISFFLVFAEIFKMKNALLNFIYCLLGSFKAVKSKIIILLTDGEPTPEKIDPSLAIDMAKQYGIKVYTIGIGNEEGGFIQHPFLGLQRVDFKIDVDLLKKIAQETGGKFFRANNPAQMRQIYNTIDSLEKTEYQTDIFHNYYEAFLTFVWILLLLFFLEMFFRLYFWRGICN